IAKGYALDRMLATLARHGVARALVVGGGDVAVAEPPPGESAWRIELGAVTEEGGAARGTLLLARAAVASSGDLLRGADIDGARRSHILDPRTALALTTRTGASVVARDGMTADALATAATVLGIESASELWSRFPDCDFRVVRGSASGSPRALE